MIILFLKFTTNYLAKILLFVVFWFTPPKPNQGIFLQKKSYVSDYPRKTSLATSIYLQDFPDIWQVVPMKKHPNPP